MKELSSLLMNTMTQVQILHETIYISNRANTLAELKQVVLRFKITLDKCKLYICWLLFYWSYKQK